MKIRQMTEADLRQVAKLYEEANQFASHRDILKWTKKGLKEFPRLNYVCDRQGKVICGISAILLSKSVAEINDLTVVKGLRNRHIGSQLIKRMLDCLRELGVKKARLWVHWKNTRAIPFYHRHGFHLLKTGITKGIEGVPDGEDIIYMEKDL